jgi:lipopolysaccharide exporter
MPSRASLTSRMQQALAGPLVRGLAAYGGAELLNRVVRLGATVVIARQLAPELVGEAALALTLFELVRVLNGIGVGQRIIAAEESELAAVCNSAHRLFWGWAVVLVAVQWLVAAGLALIFQQQTAAWMLAVLAFVYLLMPGGLVQCHLAMRAGRNAALARTLATQAMADHLLTAALLLAWPSAWSVVLPKLLTAPIWLVMSRRNHPWQPDPAAGRAPVAAMVRHGSGVLAAEALSAVRQQGDKLLIVALLGNAALGSWYFAFNAGLGIVTSLISAFATVSFPMLCAARPGVARDAVLRRLVLGGGLLFAALIAAQSLLAPIYVPLVFGPRWAFAAPLITILCVAGLGHLAAAITSNWLRAHGRVASDARRSLILCVAALGGLWIGCQYGGLEAAAIGLVAGTLLATLASAALTLGAPLRAATPQTTETMA